MPTVECRDVGVEYRTARSRRQVRALQGVTLSLPSGSFTSIVGPSGCGKTTFLNVLAGLLPAWQGTVSIDGRQVSRPGPDRAMVFQSPSLLPWRTVESNVRYGLELQRVSRSIADERVRSLLKLVGLDGFEHSFPRELSGGMQQRVNLARALATDPAVLLLDEPFASLDAQTREFMQWELLKIWQQTRKTAVFVTHQIDEAVYLSDQVVVLSARPGTVRAVVTIDCPRPRSLKLKREPAFLAYVDQIWTMLEDEGHRSNRIWAVPPNGETDELITPKRANGVVSKDDLLVRPGEPAEESDAEESDAEEPAEPSLARASHYRTLMGALGVVLFVIVWQWFGTSGMINPLFLSAPSRILAAAAGLVQEGSIWNDLRVSGTEFLFGYLAAIAVGVALGLLMGWYRTLEAILDPFVNFLYSTPRIALLPLIVIWVGIGFMSKVLVIFLGAFFPILINTIAGIQNLDESLLKAARSLGAGDLQIFRTIALPASVPFILAGLRLGVGHALVGVFVGELVASNAGIGYALGIAGNTFQTDTVFVYVLIFGGSGMLLTSSIQRIERRFQSWRPQG